MNYKVLRSLYYDFKYHYNNEHRHLPSNCIEIVEFSTFYTKRVGLDYLTIKIETKRSKDFSIYYLPTHEFSDTLPFFFGFPTEIKCTLIPNYRVSRLTLMSNDRALKFKVYMSCFYCANFSEEPLINASRVKFIVVDRREESGNVFTTEEVLKDLQTKYGGNLLNPIMKEIMDRWYKEIAPRDIKYKKLPEGIKNIEEFYKFLIKYITLESLAKIIQKHSDISLESVNEFIQEYYTSKEAMTLAIKVAQTNRTIAECILMCTNDYKKSVASGLRELNINKIKEASLIATLPETILSRIGGYLSLKDTVNLSMVCKATNKDGKDFFNAVLDQDNEVVNNKEEFLTTTTLLSDAQVDQTNLAQATKEFRETSV